MKKLSFLLLFAMLVTGSSLYAQKAPKLDTPQQTFKVLVKAIKKRDLDTYRQCWTPERLEQEGMISRLQTGDKGWEELQEIFLGPQKLKDKPSAAELEGQSRFKTTVIAPKAEEGGIGTISMVLMEGKWLMWSW